MGEGKLYGGEPSNDTTTMTTDALCNKRADALYNIPQNAGCSDLAPSYRYCYFYTI